MPNKEQSDQKKQQIDLLPFWLISQHLRYNKHDIHSDKTLLNYSRKFWWAVSGWASSLSSSPFSWFLNDPQQRGWGDLQDFWALVLVALRFHCTDCKTHSCTQAIQRHSALLSPTKRDDPFCRCVCPVCWRPAQRAADKPGTHRHTHTLTQVSTRKPQPHTYTPHTCMLTHPYTQYTMEVCCAGDILLCVHLEVRLSLCVHSQFE